MPRLSASRIAFASLVTKPVVIDGEGEYVTRRGERVTIKRHSPRHQFDCFGSYASGQADHWHPSGRLYFGTESGNDIVARKA